MAITTLDGAIAGMINPQQVLKVGATMEAAGIYYSPFYVSGRPGAAVAPTPGLTGAALTTYSGQIPFPAAVGGENIYLARMTAAANVVGRLVLCDRLWHNSGFTITTVGAQAVNSVAFPARDLAGTTNGDGIMVGIEVSTATTNAGAITNTTMSYTNQGGTAGNTATIASYPATATLGTFVPFQLAAGDTGVRSIQSLTLGTSYVAGVIHLVAYRVIASVTVGIANVGQEADLVQLGMPLMYDSSVPFLLWLPSATTAATIQSEIVYTQG